MITTKTGKLIPEVLLSDKEGHPLGDRRYILDASAAAKRGELSEGARQLLNRSSKEVQDAFAKLASTSINRH